MNTSVDIQPVLRIQRTTAERAVAIARALDGATRDRDFVKKAAEGFLSTPESPASRVAHARGRLQDLPHVSASPIAEMTAADLFDEYTCEDDLGIEDCASLIIASMEFLVIQLEGLYPCGAVHEQHRWSRHEFDQACVTFALGEALCHLYGIGRAATPLKDVEYRFLGLRNDLLATSFDEQMSQLSVDQAATVEELTRNMERVTQDMGRATLAMKWIAAASFAVALASLGLSIASFTSAGTAPSDACAASAGERYSSASSASSGSGGGTAPETSSV